MKIVKQIVDDVDMYIEFYYLNIVIITKIGIQ